VCRQLFLWVTRSLLDDSLESFVTLLEPYGLIRLSFGQAGEPLGCNMVTLGESFPDLLVVEVRYTLEMFQPSGQVNRSQPQTSDERDESLPSTLLTWSDSLHQGSIHSREVQLVEQVVPRSVHTVEHSSVCA